MMEKQIWIYRRPDGREPFRRWLDSLRDQVTRQKIQARIGRVRLGNLGYTRSVGNGVHELKIDYGPGYRVYFGQVGNELVILLCGGDKSSQHEDVETAKAYWADYQKRSRPSGQ
jgi:putative addiction module killer protein